MFASYSHYVDVIRFESRCLFLRVTTMIKRKFFYPLGVKISFNGDVSDLRYGEVFHKENDHVRHLSSPCAF